MARGHHLIVSIIVCVLGVDALTPGGPSVERKTTRKAMVELLIAASLPFPALALNPMTETKKRRTSVLPEEQRAYLTEPTEEFKKEEAEVAAFRKRQAEYRKKWDGVFASFQEAPDDPALAGALSSLAKLVQINGGLPYGLRLTDMITLCRRVKSKAIDRGGWDTPVELEYMTLVRTVKRAQNPNLSTEDTGFL